MGRSPWLEGRPRGPYESAFWSLARFAHVNGLSMHRALNMRHTAAVRARDSADSSMIQNYPGRLLRPTHLWCSKYIRFCPLCAHCGWVPDLYSLPVLELCPFHGVPLAHECCACRQPVRAAAVRTSKRPFYCSTCKSPWSGAPPRQVLDLEDEWPPDDMDAMEQLAVVDRTYRRLVDMPFAPPRRGDLLQRNRTEFIRALWGFARNLEPENTDALARATHSETISDAYAIGFRRKWCSELFGTDTETARSRVEQYVELRGAARRQLADKVSRLEHAASPEAPFLFSSAAAHQTIENVAASIAGWQARFEGPSGSAAGVVRAIDAQITLDDADRLWRYGFFVDEIVTEDWRSYCLAKLFDSLDGYRGWQHELRSGCRLAQLTVHLDDYAHEILVISEGCWPILDDYANAHRLRISPTEVEQLLKKRGRLTSAECFKLESTYGAQTKKANELTALDKWYQSRMAMSSDAMRGHVQYNLPGV